MSKQGIRLILITVIGIAMFGIFKNLFAPTNNSELKEAVKKRYVFSGRSYTCRVFGRQRRRCGKHSVGQNAEPIIQIQKQEKHCCFAEGRSSWAKAFWNKMVFKL